MIAIFYSVEEQVAVVGVDYHISSGVKMHAAICIKFPDLLGIDKLIVGIDTEQGNTCF